MNKVYHFTDSELWNKSAEDYWHPSLDSEGFIHFSYYPQLRGTLEKHFAGVTSVLIVEMDQEKLNAELKIENEFPHLYGKLNRDSVLNVFEVNCINGTWDLSKIQP